MGKSKAAVPRASNKAAPPSNAFTQLYKAYISETPSHFKLIDAFLLFLFVTGVLQFVYCVVLSDYPFNSFLAGFAATVGQFVLTLALRMQIGARADTKDRPRVTEGRALAEFVLASVVLHFFVVNFLV